MATIPTTQQLADQHLAALEGGVSQTSPLHDKAFLRVLAVVLALGHTGLYKLALERSRQNLALTANGEDLDSIGNEIGVFRKLSETAQFTATIPAVAGITIPITATFIGDINGQLYTLNAPAIAQLGDVATLSIASSVPGVIGNLQPGDSLTIVSPLPGVGATATVISVDNVGSEDEMDDDYRVRILFELQATKGGGNASDYKRWAEAVAGVQRAFPYAGKPVGGGTSYPGDRTVYVQADPDIDADGIPSVGLLTEVRSALNYDPATGASRPGLGLVDSTLYVEAITRTAVDVTITNLVCPAGTEASVRDAISDALTPYFPLFAPYVEGVDLPQDRNDRITNPALSTVLQEVLDATGSSAASVEFGVSGVSYAAYQLSAGELVKLGAVNYVTV